MSQLSKNNHPEAKKSQGLVVGVDIHIQTKLRQNQYFASLHSITVAVRHRTISNEKSPLPVLDCANERSFVLPPPPSKFITYWPPLCTKHQLLPTFVAPSTKPNFNDSWSATIRGWPCTVGCMRPTDTLGLRGATRKEEVSVTRGPPAASLSPPPSPTPDWHTSGDDRHFYHSPTGSSCSKRQRPPFLSKHSSLSVITSPFTGRGPCWPDDNREHTASAVVVEAEAGETVPAWRGRCGLRDGAGLSSWRRWHCQGLWTSPHLGPRPVVGSALTNRIYVYILRLILIAQSTRTGSPQGFSETEAFV